MIVLPRILIWFSIFVFTSSITYANACKLKVGWEEWAPYIVYNNQSFSGPEYDFLKKVSQKAGCSIEMIEVAWSDAVERLKRKELELLYAASFSSEREKFANFSIPYREEIFLLGLADKIETPEVDLSHWLGEQENKVFLGLIKGSYYGQKIDQFIKNNRQSIEVISFQDDVPMLAALRNGDISAVILERAVAGNHIGSGVFFAPIKNQKTEPLRYMFSKSVSNDVVERFNQAIRHLNSN